jgi:hypothetical protein
MESRWGAVDRLMRELGGLRDDARSLDPMRVAADVVAEVDEVIARAAQAVDETIESPESEDVLLGARLAIVSARHRITALREAARASHEQIERSLELRQQSARLTYESARRRPPQG